MKVFDGIVVDYRNSHVRWWKSDCLKTMHIIYWSNRYIFGQS